MEKSVKIHREVSVWLMIGIFLIPMLFAWILLIEGYSPKARFLGFAWLLFGVLASAMSKMVLGVI